MPEANVVAAIVSDLHLTVSAPSSRKEEDWLQVQAKRLSKLRKLGVPVLCAGDIFDRWHSPPELVHFALDHLPDRMVSIAGQHDLPHHSMEDMHRSAYGVLVRVGKIMDISRGSCQVGGLKVSGYGWGVPLEDRPGENPDVALVHRYVWSNPETSHPQADKRSHVSRIFRKLQRPEVIFCGDNHVPFRVRLGKRLVVNCGTFIRRHSNERDYPIGICYLRSDGTVVREKYSGEDSFASFSEEERRQFTRFVKELESLAEHDMDFEKLVRSSVETSSLSELAKRYILLSLEQIDNPDVSEA
jgi:DNA repair exonuclease SbcCD nuclease subunit